MVLILLAEGFEEIEALMPLDILRRANIDVKTVGIGGKTITGAHGISVLCDMCEGELELKEIECVIFPGGMPGALNLDAAPITDILIDAVVKKGGRLAAICAAPLVLGRRGLLNGKSATCYPGFEKELIGAEVSKCGVVTDGNITTAKGMGVALDFAMELLTLLKGKESANKISRAIMENAPGRSE